MMDSYNHEAIYTQAEMDKTRAELDAAHLERYPR